MQIRCSPAIQCGVVTGKKLARRKTGVGRADGQNLRYANSPALGGQS
jgi:hypothetical protein